MIKTIVIVVADELERAFPNYIIDRHPFTINIRTSTDRLRPIGAIMFNFNSIKICSGKPAIVDYNDPDMLDKIIKAVKDIEDVEGPFSTVWVSELNAEDWNLLFNDY